MCVRERNKTVLDLTRKYAIRASWLDCVNQRPVVFKPLPALLHQPIGVAGECLMGWVKLCSYTVVKVT